MFGEYFVNNFIIQKVAPSPWIIGANALGTLCLLGMALSSSFFLFTILFMIASIPAAFSWPNTLNLISINAPAAV